MSKFYVAPAKFESKSIVANNSLIFHRGLSDATKLLILAMHAIMSCTYTWVIVQEDLQNRMGWGKEKMRGAIKEAVQFGYLRVRQGRKTELKDEKGNIVKGQFSCNEFDFDVTGGFLNIPEENIQKPSDNECEPETVNPSTAKPCAVNQPLPIPSSLPIPGKQQQASPDSAVVVSLSLKNIDIPQDEKIWISKNYDEETIRHAVEFACHPLTIHNKGLIQTIKWACKETKRGNRPAIPKDEAQEALKRSQEKKQHAMNNKIMAEKIAQKYYDKTQDASAIQLRLDYIELDFNGNGRKNQIFYFENNFKQLIEHELRKKGLEDCLP